MKQPERVAELLAELRALTETDFERHRIDVLERDLTAPPTVEVIKETQQRFNGVTYYVQRNNGHYYASEPAHRDIWRYYYGEIPAGYEIHHVDENKANNDIANLQCLTKAEHRKKHIRPMPNETYTYTCDVCGKTFTSSNIKKNNRFCSKSCCAIWHTQNDKTKRVCAYCGREFFAYKYSRSRCCSITCGKKLAWQTKKRNKGNG